MTARFGPYVGPSPTFTAAPRAATVTSGFSLSSASVSISVTGAGALLHRTRSRVDAALPVGAAGSGALSGDIGTYPAARCISAPRSFYCEASSIVRPRTNLGRPCRKAGHSQ